MNFRFSQEVNPSTYKTDGLADSVPVRVHRDVHRVIEGALQAQRDWSSHVRGLGNKFSLMSVAIPECLPERLEIMSYANDFAFLYDGMGTFMFLMQWETHLDGHNTQDPGPKHKSFVNMFRDGVMDRPHDANWRPEKQLQARVWTEMMAIDRPRAIKALAGWAISVDLGSEYRARTNFKSLEDYISARVIDFGERIWYGALTFGMALSIPPVEFGDCMNLARPGYVALALTNDLYSWEKERNAAKAAGQDFVFNAIWVIMQERSRDKVTGLLPEDAEAEAMATCRAEIKKYVPEYHTTHDPTLSKDLKAYLEAVLLIISGNLVWSIYRPRYNSKPQECQHPSEMS
ncbi:terpenoid synthase [Rhypophila sp. PSN 637]